MKRRLFTILSAFSLLLCVAVVVVWVRSYWVLDRIFYNSVDKDKEFYAISTRGNVALIRLSRSRHDLLGWEYTRSVPPPAIDRRDVAWNFLGIMRGSEAWGMDRLDQFVLPLWAVLVPILSVALPSWVNLISHRRRRNRHRTGRCPSCGYDLRATPRRCAEREARDRGRRHL
jgi:hypothetical protein